MAAIEALAERRACPWVHERSLIVLGLEEVLLTELLEPRINAKTFVNTCFAASSVCVHMFCGLKCVNTCFAV